MNGISTNNTLIDVAIVLALMTLPPLVLRFGLGSLLTRLGKLLIQISQPPQTQIPPQPGPVAPVSDQRLEVAEVRREPVAMEWIALIQLLLPLILQAIDLFRQRTGRAPTRVEVAHIQREVIARYRRGEVPDDLSVVLPGQTVPHIE